tara:strand:- start:198 stop:437 length:240 start_codon:yes stop_codon:yes gene_type:complete
MINNIKNLTSSSEKLVKYAVVQVSIRDNDDILDIDNIFCDKKHIFNDEKLADQFCDHANKTEKLSYQWIVQEIIIDRKR